MPERILFPEFRNEYETTRYPFLDTATLLSTTKQSLDADLFLDASLYPIGSVGGYLYVSKINVRPRLSRISIADRTRKEKAFVEFDPLIAPDVLRIRDEWGRPAGILVSDSLRLSRFTSWAEGDHLFAPDATQFVPSCVVPTPEIGVRGVLTEKGELFTGDLMIVGQNGVVVRQAEDGVIRVDIVGDPLFRRKLCFPFNLFKSPGFVKTINGCPPDKFGNFNITVGNHLSEETIIRIRKTDAGLMIEAVGSTIQQAD
jgi:hypothetical protein